jgi:hypothetical protein
MLAERRTAQPESEDFDRARKAPLQLFREAPVDGDLKRLHVGVTYDGDPPDARAPGRRVVRMRAVPAPSVDRERGGDVVPYSPHPVLSRVAPDDPRHEDVPGDVARGEHEAEDDQLPDDEQRSNRAPRQGEVHTEPA